ncbi:site-specific integrase [Bacteroides salyersiae]|jgi:integrase|uniref:site-specific integrase n=1 Tax=Bacteroides salyersiae TaxID=291644 RepID=UPI001C8B6724|nr:site-specific integrase [Bacteroides salyersiae]
MKKEIKIKEPIKLRTKELLNGCYSLYLDIYINGKRKYEFLKLYIIPERSKIDKERNAETLKLANAIKAEKIIALQNGKYGFNLNKKRLNISLTDYIQYLAHRDSVKKSKKTLMNTLIYHLRRYDKKGILLKNIDKEYILKFIKYLSTANQEHSRKEKQISANTQVCYFKELNYCLNYAVVEDILPLNPMNKIRNEDKPKRKKTEREFLTIEELKALSQTDFYNKTLKQAFLFSCFCGLRHCDIVTLTWGNLKRDNMGKTQLHMVQQKTQEVISLPLSKEALKQLPKRNGALDTDIIFHDLISLGRTNEILSRWAQAAGINKHITFHVARHTHATMMITLGADLYTVSKLLGHTNIQTTQIYAKIVDETKSKAIDLIPDLT